MSLASEFVPLGITIVLLTLVWRSLPRSARRPKNFPPGPPSFPILGHVHPLGFRIHEVAMGWKGKYGPIVGVWIGSYRAVIISDYELVKEALGKLTFSGRPTLPLAARGVAGIVHASGKQWIEQKRVIQKAFRAFDTSIGSLETIIGAQAKYMVDSFNGSLGVPVCMTSAFEVAALNVAWAIIAGECLQPGDPKTMLLLDMIAAIKFKAKYQIFFAVAPWLGKFLRKFMKRGIEFKNKRQILAAILPTCLSKYEMDKSVEAEETEKHKQETGQPLQKFLVPIVNSHIASHDQGQPRDLIDMYITEMKTIRTRNPESAVRMEECFISTLRDVLGAAVESTTATLSWIALYIAKYEHVQERMAEEIRRVVGVKGQRSTVICLADRPNMPFTEAVIHEVTRRTSVTPVALMHCTTADLHFHGYDIPKGTVVFPNLYEAHNNVQLWGDPQSFRPERFLSEDGTKCEKRTGFLPFSIGKRACIGEKIARDELFLFTTAFLQAFKVRINPSEPPPTFEPLQEGILKPQPYKLVLTSRVGPGDKN